MAATTNRHSTRTTFGRLCATAVLGCAASVLASAPTAPGAPWSRDLGALPPPTYDEGFNLNSLYLWYIYHCPTVDKPRGDAADPDRTHAVEGMVSPGHRRSAAPRPCAAAGEADRLHCSQNGAVLQSLSQGIEQWDVLAGVAPSPPQKGAGDVALPGAERHLGGPQGGRQRRVAG